jgi:hypothetical protein
MRFALVILFLTLFSFAPAFAQQDSVINTAPVYQQQNARHFLLDSVAQAMALRNKAIKDSVSLQYVQPDPNRPNQYVEMIMSQQLYHGNQFLDIPLRSQNILREGHMRKTRDPWIITIIIALVLYTGLLNRVMSKDLSNVLQSFYSKRVFNQVSKENSMINSWAFLGLFLLFSFTFGLFLYQLASYNDRYYSISGFQLFLSLSSIILVLFAIKFLVLKLIGFVFNISKLVSEYIAILYLTYFNIAFVFLPVALCFSLLAGKYIPIILAIAIIIIIIIFVWQYLRSSVNIISNFRFHKFYLIIYLCALEICPILILIKALSL